MLTLTVRHIVFDGMKYIPGNRADGLYDCLVGPWELMSEYKYTGSREELEAKMEEIDDHDWGSHFYDFDDNGREMFIS